MTKYLVFRNQPDSGQVNEPGSREEMASEIANVVSQDRMPPNYYIAFWVNEIQEMVEKAYMVDDAIGEASGGIYQAMIAYNNAIEASSNFKDLTSLSIKALDRAFEYFEVESAYEVSTKVEEIYSVESFEHHHV